MGRSRMARHGSFPTTADMGLWARGPDAASLYEGLALALFGAMTDLRKVRRTDRRPLRPPGTEPTGLAVRFLSDLLTLFHTDGFVARSVAVRVRAAGVEAELWGEPFDPGRHSRRVEIKAVTYHAANVDARRGTARVVVDI